MGKLLIVNGSPRPEVSNSAKYIDIVKKFSKENIDVVNALSFTEFETESSYEHMLLVFPLYADSLPVPMMRFLKNMQMSIDEEKLSGSFNTSMPKIHVIINCGFLEPEQNDTAVDIVKFFCNKNALTFGSCLKIGAGEAILKTPFAFFAKRNIKKLVKAISNDSSCEYMTSMPISKNSFIKASTKYWLKYGEKNGISKKEMETMDIEA